MNEILTHDIKLLGLKMPYEDENASYFEELPVHFTKCDNFRKLYRLKKRKQKDTKENLEIYEGLDIVIHDQYAKKYFYRTLKYYTNMNNMLKYFKDGNLYILKDEYQVKEEPEVDDIPEPEPKKESIKNIVNNEEDALIF